MSIRKPAVCILRLASYTPIALVWRAGSMTIDSPAAALATACRQKAVFAGLTDDLNVCLNAVGR